MWKQQLGDRYSAQPRVKIPTTSQINAATIIFIEEKERGEES